jgi:hypothetical protein
MLALVAVANALMVLDKFVWNLGLKERGKAYGYDEQIVITGFKDRYERNIKSIVGYIQHTYYIDKLIIGRWWQADQG